MDVRLLYTQKHAHGNQMDYELKTKRMSTMEKSCNTSKKMRPHTDSILLFEIWLNIHLVGKRERK